MLACARAYCAALARRARGTATAWRSRSARVGAPMLGRLARAARAAGLAASRPPEPPDGLGKLSTWRISRAEQPSAGDSAASRVTASGPCAVEEVSSWDPFHGLTPAAASAYAAHEHAYAVEVLSNGTANFRGSLEAEIKSRWPPPQSAVSDGAGDRAGDHFYFRRRAPNTGNVEDCRVHFSAPNGDLGLHSCHRIPELAANTVCTWLAAEPEVLIDWGRIASWRVERWGVDPALLDASGATGMAIAPSHDAIAFMMDLTGGEDYSLFVFAMEDTSWHLADVVPGVWGFCWTGNDSLVYTTRDSLLRPASVFHHRIGELLSSDEMLLHEPDDRFFVSTSRTKDGEYLAISSHSKTASEVALVPTRHPLTPPVVVHPRASFRYFVEHRKGIIYALAEIGPKGDFVLASLPASSLMNSEKPPDMTHWNIVYAPERDTHVIDIDFFDSCFVVHLRDHSGTPGFAVRQYIDEDGAAGKVAWLPCAYQSAAVYPGANVNPNASIYNFSTSHLLSLNVEWEIDLLGDQTPRILNQPDFKGNPHFAPSMYESYRVMMSRDGEAKLSSGPDSTGVPVTLVHHKDIHRNGRNPTLCFVYGAYGESLFTPYDAGHICLLRRGWVLAFCHVRGGGELGPGWHHAGKGSLKQNSSLDLEAAIEGLQACGYTSADKVAVSSTSAGGMVAADLCHRRPDLLAAAVLGVPFLDVLNTMADHTLPLTLHEHDEFLDPLSSKTSFLSVRSVCPYQTAPLALPSNAPHILVTGSTLDSRVPLTQPAKYVAKRRQSSKNQDVGSETFMLTDTEHGHFGGDQNIETLMYTFLFRSLGLQCR